MAKDPVCGMDVEEQKVAGKSEYRGSLIFLLFKELQGKV